MGMGERGGGPNHLMIILLWISTELVFTVNSMEEVVGEIMMVGIQFDTLSGPGQAPVSKR